MSAITKEFTKEQLQQIIETDHVQCGEASALARIALASLEAEPVCVIDQSNLDYLKSGADADVWPASRTEMGDVLLYRTAPPAPENAEPVAWLWSHRKHPSEVSLVRPEDDERAEGAHWSGWSCQALYAAPPAPVSVPDYPETLPCPVMLEPGLRFGKGVNTRTMLGALQRHAEYHAELEAMTPEERAEHDAGMKEFAAMLQGAEPVTTAYKLPANTPCKDAPEHIWLQTAGAWPESGEFSELTWCSENQHPDDTLYVRGDAVADNRPELPDGWVACSERMPDIGTEIFYFCQDDGLRGCGIVSSSNFSGKGDAELYVHAEGYDLHFGVDISHWMPLPASPQQEA
ncbi:DUF551 domain-containing protein [Enterobacter hormaechei]|nr:DUF551 domain-containing protein [Enterobacter hormaechei]MCE1380917.1 DUF551 domain-containing protein [Enterobacter hormaechei]